MNLDSEVLLQTYDLADMIIASEETMEYLKYKQALDKDPKVIELKKKLGKEKEEFEEAERFGQFHPDYNKIMGKVKQTIKDIEEIEVVRKYLKAEEKLDDLLYSVSKILATAISDSIKIPKNEVLPEGEACVTGGCNTCGIQESCSIR